MSEITRIAILGATGLVGQKTLELLEEIGPENIELKLYASERSEGRTLLFRGVSIQVETIPSEPPDLDYAILSLPADEVRKIVPVWRTAGIRLIDHSSAYRMDADVPLLVPEVNPNTIQMEKGLIANGNCNAIPVAVALAPLRKWGIKEVHVSTYQSVSGARTAGIERWEAEIRGTADGKSPFPRRIHGNVIPIIGAFDPDGYNVEETKLVNELVKMLELPDLVVGATCVRVPVSVGHSAAVEVELGTIISANELLDELSHADGVILARTPEEVVTPFESEGHNEVFVGRVRRHPKRPESWLMWVVSDNLRKGAATNAVQILNLWIKKLN